jgi:acyl-CoA thioester hydrolase
MEIGVIVADIHVAYQSPTHYGDPIKTGAKVTKIGNKSMTVEQCVMDADGRVMAKGEVVLVTFDYKSMKTIPVPDDWKKKLSEFEGLNI